MSPRLQTSHPKSRAVRFASTAAVAFALVLECVPAWSQEWSQYLAFDDLFSIDFPGEPAIGKTTYKTENGISLPANVYTAKDEFGTYKVTAVNWSTAAAQHEALFNACKASTGDLRGGENPGICGNWARNEIGGATAHAAFDFLKRGGKVVHFAVGPIDGIEGLQLELRNANQSQTFAEMLWHEGYLYIAEATAPKDAPPPSAFPISIQLLDKEGRRIQYEGRYSPLYPVPKRRR